MNPPVLLFSRSGFSTEAFVFAEDFVLLGKFAFRPVFVIP